MGGALLAACDLIQDGSQYGQKIRLNQKLEIMKKRRKLETVDASHVKYDIIKHCCFLCTICAFFT